MLLVGCGATGTVLANHLARAGVGRLVLLDRDIVEITNLQRQLLYDEEDARGGVPKAVAAARRLSAVNSEIVIEPRVADFHAGNAEALLEGADLVLDGTDNFETRYVLNDACVKHGRPWVYCGAVSTYGMTMLVRPGDTPCLRCLFPEPPPPGSAATCDTAGVLGPAVGVVASLAAVEALRCLVGAPPPEGGGLLHVDAWDLEWHRFQVSRKEDCPCCARREFPYLEVAAAGQATALCGRNAVQVTPARAAELDLAAVAERLRPLGETQVTPFLLRFRAGEQLLTLFPDGRAIVQGTDDPAAARSLYARYVGV